MRPRKQKQRTNRGAIGDCFFQEQLKGEVALSRKTAEELYDEATAFMLEEPWKYLADTELILMDDPESGQRCYCCIMGAAGEWCGMQVYQGVESYRLYRKVADGNTPDRFSFYENLKGVSLEIVRAVELENTDRLLLKALNHPCTKGMLAPQFRATRPGYLPWHVTETEGRLLRDCLQAVNHFCSTVTDEELDEFWGEPDMFPLVIANDKEPNCKIRPVTAPAPGPAPLEVPDLDEERVRRIARECKKSDAILEAEHFFAPGIIGGKNERKMYTQLTLIADANSGFLYHSEFGMAGQSHAATVSAALLAAMERSHFVPAEVRVKETALGIGLAGLGSALGFRFSTVKSLPATREAKEFFFEKMAKERLEV